MSRKTNNIVLCYHGITEQTNEKSSYISYMGDFINQIKYLLSLGYSFIPPSKYADWYTGVYTPSDPIAAIVFDDALSSITLAVSWLAGKGIPYGIAVIGRKLRKYSPESGFLSWKDLNNLVGTGLCEILSHSYNMHHFGLRKISSEVTSSPIFEGPCFLDNGDYVYIDKDDSRWYWDLNHVEDTAWAFPLFGTDTLTDLPVNSSIRFKAKSSFLLSKIRCWACLHIPNSSGYDTDVDIYINDILISTNTITPINYDSGRQWPEREFLTITLDNSYFIESGNYYTLRFITRNKGDSVFRIYAVPDFSGDFILASTCTGQTYPQNQKWPAKACIILTDYDGLSVTDTEFQNYIYEDLAKNNSVINKYLKAKWSNHSTGYKEQEKLKALVIGGTYSSNKPAETKIKFSPAQDFKSELLRLKYAGHSGTIYPLIIDVFINNEKITTFAPNWKDYNWQEIEIFPYEFFSGNDYEIKFITKNTSLQGKGLIKVYVDQIDPPQPVWNSRKSSWILPNPSAFKHEISFETSEQEDSDLYPDSVYAKGSDYFWNFSTPFNGPGKAFIEFMSCSLNPVKIPVQICYPFGSYRSSSFFNLKEDIHPVLKTSLKNASLSSGFSVWEGSAKNFRNVRAQYSEFIIPRYSVQGNIEQSVILNDIDIIIGTKNK